MIVFYSKSFSGYHRARLLDFDSSRPRVSDWSRIRIRPVGHRLGSDPFGVSCSSSHLLSLALLPFPHQTRDDFDESFVLRLRFTLCFYS